MASAYRPFDGTDGDVAELHTLELELGPVGYLRAGGVHDFVTGGVLNYGFARRFELVLQGFDFAPWGGTTPAAPNKFMDTSVFVKTVLREGCLQEKGGPSVATEVGPGAIWTVNHKLALDGAMREALVGGQNVSEIRAGFTWVIP
jgi:hypothetical protein